MGYNSAVSLYAFPELVEGKISDTFCGVHFDRWSLSKLCEAEWSKDSVNPTVAYR